MKEKIKKWYEDNSNNIWAGITISGAMLLGIIIGKSIGEFKGYVEGIRDGVDVTITASDITKN